MDIYKQKWTRLQNEIFRVLCINVFKPMAKREIAKILKVSPTAVGNSLKQMEKEGIARVVNYNGKTNISSVELNRENQKAIELKRAENLKMIYESGLADFLEEKFPGTAIILFGSYSKGEDTYNSDIDIAIVGIKEKQIDTEEFDKSLKKEIRVNFFKNWGEIGKNLKDNILNGIILAGGIDL